MGTDTHISISRSRFIEAVYVYDRVMSFDQEMEVIWKRKITLITALYTLMHLLTFILLFVGAFLALYEGPCDVSLQFTYRIRYSLNLCSRMWHPCLFHKLKVG